MHRPLLTLLLCLAVLTGCNTGSRDALSSSTAPGSTAPGSAASGTLGATAGQTAAASPFGPDPVAVLAFGLSATAGDVDVAQVDVASSGSVDESTLGTAQLFDDANGNGLVDAGEVALADAPAPAANDGSYSFQPLTPVRIAAGQTRSFVVAVDATALTGKAAARASGQTLALSVQAPAGIVAQNGAAAPVTPSGSFPLSGQTTLELGEHVLISEVCTGPGTGATTAEFVELFNPTGAPIDLSTTYLTDFTDDPTRGKFYWKLPTGENFGPAAADFSYDFIVRFPAAANIQPGQVLVVAVDGEGFKAAHGVDPDYCMRNRGTTAAQQMLSWDGVAPGVNFNATPIHNSAGLTGPSGGNFGNGELVCLFRWDGVADLVQDVDLLNYGNPSATNTAINKSTGQGIPDVKVDSAFDNDSTESTFQDDSTDLFQLDHRAPLGASIERVDFTEGAEKDTGGNGVAGHDETSEDFGDGMGGSGTFAPAAAPTPGQL